MVLPDGVKCIGEVAFRGCSSLTSIVLPSGVKSIGDFTFY
ncbi:MAG: leucine-rich repeat protein, partial [Thermoguttaceae bacterium]|nr:leucine-rich repeat protein [Thermoguttaceae bacterium]